MMGRKAETVAPPFQARYPQSRLTREMIKGGVITLAFVVMALAVRTSIFPAMVFAVIASYFGGYFFQQLLRTRVRLQVDSNTLLFQNLLGRKELLLDRLDELQLDFYPHGRKKEHGTFSLVLGQGSQRIKVDSVLDHFAGLLKLVAKSARASRLAVPGTTEARLRELGL